MMKLLLRRRKFLGILIVSSATLSCEGLIAGLNKDSSPKPQNATSYALNSRTEKPPERLWSILQQSKGNSHAILFRHAIAPGGGDPPQFQLNDCSTQRNLSEEGRKQAAKIGQELKRQKIPIAQVLSSQWCRCLETARLMELGEVQAYPPLNSFFSDRSRTDEQTAQLRSFLLKNHQKTGVMILVTHQVNITALTDIFPQSGEGVVVRVDRDKPSIEVLGRLSP
jgi:phosphohistidine phosphatase SixA